jgi:hypothetical protein
MDYMNINEVVKSLDFPKRNEVDNNFRKLIFGRDRESLFIELDELISLKKTWEHVQRVALKGVRVADYLEIGNIEVSLSGNVRQAIFICGLSHDVGKINPQMRKAIKKSEEMQEKGGVLEEEYLKLIREHSQISAELEDDPFIRGIIVRHHIYQKKSYPKIPHIFYDKNKFGERNAEVEYLSKLLALIDAHDSSLTRKNGNSERLTCDKSLVSLLDYYGKLDLSYNGKILPCIECSGKDLITRLYTDGVFGSP